MKYKKKPVIIEAVKYDGTLSSIKEFIPDEKNYSYSEGILNINTTEGPLHAEKGDYIIKGVHGEYYPCKPDIFEETYDLVSKE